jgi:muramoyltetrapeptide carboxypeptidase
MNTALNEGKRRPSPKLSPGDKVALVAPGGAIRRKDLLTAVRLFGELPLEVVVSPEIFLKEKWFAGSAKTRARQINAYFADPEIKAILAVRGGYGCQHLAPLLDKRIISQNPKIFMGFSDCTYLHNYFLQVCGLPTFHGPHFMDGLINEKKRKTFLQDFRRVFLESKEGYALSLARSRFVGKFEKPAPIVGGNLTLLIQTIGTKLPTVTKGKFLLIEDVNEAPYRIDRMLTHLYDAGLFYSISGLLVGNFSKLPERDEAVVSSFLTRTFGKKNSFPVIYNFPSGHSRQNRIVPLGVACLVDMKLRSASFTI